MKNIMTYAFLLFVVIVLQTVVLPSTFHALSDVFGAAWLNRVTINGFLLLAIYFSFNRDFLHGLIWVLAIIYIEKACGLFWFRSHPVTYVSIFLIAQLLKIQFVFQYAPSIRAMVFLMSLLASFIHVWVAASYYSFASPWSVFAATSIVNSFGYALLAPGIFEWLTRFDQRTVYRFEKQQTFFSTSIHA